MSDKAIIIAANPNYGDGGKVNKHIEHAEINGKVFWHLVPPGDRDISWAHPGIRKGYFYISGTDEVVYKFFIEDARRISEYKDANLEDKMKKYIPEFRENRWKENANRYALLIKNINKINPMRLDQFKLAATGKDVKRIMNYVIVFDKPISGD